MTSLSKRINDFFQQARERTGDAEALKLLAVTHGPLADTILEYEKDIARRDTNAKALHASLMEALADTACSRDGGLNPLHGPPSSSDLLVLLRARLLRRVMEAEESVKLAKQMTAERDAAWRMARAAADGHDHNRELLLALAKELGCDTDFDALPAALQKCKRNEALSWKECITSAEQECDGLKQALANSARKREDIEAERERLERENGVHQRELAELRHLATDNAEMLQRQGNALAQLQATLAMAGAPKSGDLMAWASDVRNTILGLRADSEELVGRLRNNDTARRHELAEIIAAADSLPAPLKPANGYPYSLMAMTPIQVFMLLRERALDLVNPDATPPVSGV